ncbi:MAG: cyanophycin synthetase [Candidatus Peribacteraceae bacterium]|nr:cyanophycin synthetase [Candidatus Peribacteraceae bacterium]
MVIYCSGIGGIGLSAYAAYQRSRGLVVSGSDRADSAVITDLRTQGIEVFLSQDGTHVPADADLFVFSEAVPETGPERVRAKELGIPSMSYFQALGEITKGSRLTAVCGTHGKSSVTAMAAKVLTEAGSDPSIIVGTKLRELNGRNWRRGESGLFLVEACEYRRSFLSLSPAVILLTNADGDHFDYYASQEDYEHAFIEFTGKLPKDGFLITHLRDPQCARIAGKCHAKVIDADALPFPTLATPGLHMQKNGQLVLGLASVLGIPEGDALVSLQSYAGCWRRMEMRGTWGRNVMVIDDYGHHPTEIRATIEGILGAYPERRLVVVFQPHTHDRTLKLYDGFVQSFRGADTVVIPNIYDARRERDQGTVDVPKFVQDIAKASQVTALDGRSLAETEQSLKKNILRKDDILLCMGAGDITELAGRMTK